MNGADKNASDFALSRARRRWRPTAVQAGDGEDEPSLRAVPADAGALDNGVGDELALIAPVDALIQQYCKVGVTVDYDRDLAGNEHVANFAELLAGRAPVHAGPIRRAGAADNCSTYATVPTPPLG